ncbi:MAG: hypothetical protein N3D74_00030 [Caldisericia bacterium]|nr:hypothetical protein [Caldisericia bacterium]
MKKILVLLLIGLIFVYASCIEKIPTPFVEEFKDEFEIQNEKYLSIDNFNGSVTITKWNENKISIFAEKKSLIGKGELNKVKIEIEKNGDIKIKSVKLKENPQISVTYNIKVPEKIILKDIITSNGSIEIVDLKGDSSLKSSNGFIKVTNHIGNLRCDTSNGRIELINISGSANLYTSNGKILVDGCDFVISGETSNGVIEIKRVKKVGDLKTSNGKIEVDLLSLKEGGAKFLTSNSSVYVNLKSDLNLNIEIETSNGKIDIKNLDIKIDTLKDTYLKGKLNNGGDILVIKTSNGSVYLNKID